MQHRQHRDKQAVTNRTKTKQQPPFRVRFAPTIEEAVEAARDLSLDPASHVEIAAGLMGVSEDEVRPYILARTSPRRPATIIAGRRSVVVERVAPRRISRSG